MDNTEQVVKEKPFRAWLQDLAEENSPTSVKFREIIGQVDAQARLYKYTHTVMVSEDIVDGLCKRLTGSPIELDVERLPAPSKMVNLKISWELPN